MTHKADCPFCEAFAVEVPGPSKELLWQLPDNSPINRLEKENDRLMNRLWEYEHKASGTRIREDDFVPTPEPAFVPPDLCDTQPMESLDDVRRKLRGCVFVMLAGALFWAGILIALLLVYA